MSSTRISTWRCEFSVVGLSQEIAQPVKPAFPHRAAVADPSVRHRKAAGFDSAGAYPPGLFGLDQAAFLQHLQVLNDGRQRDAEWLCQPRHRYGSLAEPLQNGPAGGVAEGMEDTVDIGFLALHRSAACQRGSPASLGTPVSACRVACAILLHAFQDHRHLERTLPGVCKSGPSRLLMAGTQP